MSSYFIALGAAGGGALIAIAAAVNRRRRRRGAELAQRASRARTQHRERRIDVVAIDDGKGAPEQEAHT